MYEQIGTSTIAGGIVQPTPFPKGDGEEDLEQISASIETMVYPGNVLHEIKGLIEPPPGSMEPTPPHFPYEGPQTLRIETGDIVLYPRQAKEIETLFKIDPAVIAAHASQAESAFSAFNGKRRLDSRDDLYKYYKFLGIARSPVDFGPTTDFKKLTVATSGVLNWVNYTDTPVEPFTPMTWGIIGHQVAATDIRQDVYESVEYGISGAWAPPEKRRYTRTNIIKPVFIPVDKQLDVISHYPITEIANEVYMDAVALALAGMTEHDKATANVPALYRTGEAANLTAETRAAVTAPAGELEKRSKLSTIGDIALRAQKRLTVLGGGAPTDGHARSIQIEELLEAMFKRAYKAGVRQASRQSAHVIGKNGGRTVLPGKTGQIILF